MAWKLVSLKIWSLRNTVKCDAFRNFVTQIKNDVLPALNTLISRAEAKYTDFVKSGEWTATPQNKQLLALQAKTQALEREKASSTTKSNKKKQSTRTSKKLSTTKHRRTREDEEWMVNPPKKGSETKDNAFYIFYINLSKKK